MILDLLCERFPDITRDQLLEDVRKGAEAFAHRLRARPASPALEVPA